jgi:hypothetical protein
MMSPPRLTNRIGSGARKPDIPVANISSVAKKIHRNTKIAALRWARSDRIHTFDINVNAIVKSVAVSQEIKPRNISKLP